MKKIRAAIVGAGGFGGYRRARIRDTDLFELAASFDINPQAMELAQREDGAKPCASYEELLAIPGLEAVFVATGGKFHEEQAVAAMRRGLHVFIEKPLCSTPAELTALMTAARETGVVVGVGHNDHRHDPLSQVIKDTVESGRIGKLAAVEANTSHSGGLCGPADQWRFDPERNPGGMLFQCGVHSLHELIYLFGPVREVAAMFRYDVHPIRTAQVAQTLLRFESGLVASLNAYHVTAYNHRIRLFGTKGNLYIDSHVRRASFQERKQGEPEPVVEVPIAQPKNEKEHSCGNVISFADAIHGKIKTPWPGLLEGARAVAVVFACDRADKEKRTVAVELPG